MHAYIDEAVASDHGLRNTIHSGALLAAMAVLLGMLGWVIAGPLGMLLAAAASVGLLLFNRSLSPAMVLRLYRAQPLSPQRVPRLAANLQLLARRAGLPSVPRMFCIPSAMVNAFTVGGRDTSAIVITLGMLRQLDLHELTGVLAHEVGHIRNSDIRVMTLADLFSRLCAFMSSAGLLALAITLPWVLLGGEPVSLLAVAMLIFAPHLITLLQLALSRTREFEADRTAALLLGDAMPLARALDRLEQLQNGFWERLLLPGRRIPEPSLLRTHPPTRERIARLLSMRREFDFELLDYPSVVGAGPAPRLVQESLPGLVVTRPRWRISGLWW